MPQLSPRFPLPNYRMIPNAGYSFIIEDQKEEMSKTGLIMSHKNKNKASIGTIYAINNDVLCPYCTKSIKNNLFQVGDHVLYSRFVAEQVDYHEEGMKEGRLFSVPTDAILAKI